ncbi:MAG: transketolase C-terminal domain-containing protein, partial [Oscillospiraceae bacterium]
FNPCDYYETKAAVKAAYEIDGPCYLRLCRMAVESINNDDNYEFIPGKGVTLKEGNDVSIIATGLMVFKALEAGKILEKQGINARIINIHTIKPIDKDIIIKAAKETKGIVTVEEHNIMSGFGSIVASITSENAPTVVKMVGVNDVFGRSGTPNELFEMYGLTAENIAKKALEIVK